MSIIQTPQWIKLNALDIAIQEGKLVNTSLEAVSKYDWRFVVDYFLHFPAKLVGYSDPLNCYKINEVAQGLLQYCMDHE